MQAEQCPPVPFQGVGRCSALCHMDPHGDPLLWHIPSSLGSRAVAGPRPGWLPILCSFTDGTLLLGSGHTISGSSEDWKPSQMANDFHEPWLMAQSEF